MQSDDGATEHAQDADVPDRVVIINDFSEKSGGSTTVALQSARLLTASGIPVSYLAGDGGAVPKDLGSMEVASLGGTEILAAPRIHGAIQGLYNFEAERFVASWIAKNDSPKTIYHVHNWCKILSPSIFRALRPVARRLLITAHDFFIACPNGAYFNFPQGRACDVRPMTFGCLGSQCDRRSYSHKLWRFARHSVMREFCDLTADAGAVVAVHEGMVPLLRRLGILTKNLTVLRNPVVPWRGERIPAEENSKLLFVGRLETDKGVDLLASAAREAGAAVCLIGEGTVSGRLAEEFAEVEQLGWQEPGQIGAYAAQSRALVMPTRHRETFGIVAFEALTSGLPVLLSSHSMIADEVQDLGFGLTFDPHDRGSLAALIRRVFADVRLVEQMSRKAHEHARRLVPTPQEWVAALLRLYCDVLRREALQRNLDFAA